ncbi:MAG: TonB-dependent receptor [Caulobacter sp.]|nr:TonB-dependent receptor [Caulobacter sp.]
MRVSGKAIAPCAMLAVCLGGAGATPALAQDAGSVQAAVVEEVIITARKREETDIATPVSVTAMGAAQIDRQAIFNVYDLAQRLPTVTISNTGSGVGGTIFVRGIGSAVTTGNSIDQSVSFDFDGVPISRGNVLRLGQYDLGQIQVMKGPQALFFGKNSPAGVIAFTSKDPTSEFELTTKLAYEPYANTTIGELVVSGPLTESLSGRLFLRGAASDGGKDNRADEALGANLIVPNTVFAGKDSSWGYSDKFVRGTLLWNPTPRLKVRLKAAYDAQDGDPVTAVKERFYCPQGVSQNLTAAAMAAPGGFAAGALAPALAAALAVDDCRANGTTYQGGLNPDFMTRAPHLLVDDDSYGGSKSRISMLSGEINYDLTENISLTSVTGLTRITEGHYGSFSYGVSSPAVLAFATRLMHRQFTQELRLFTHFDGPLNFMLGGFYQDAFLSSQISNFALAPYTIPQYRIPNKVWSGFAQGIWDVTPTVELAVGARYTEEKKTLTLLRDGVAQPVAKPETKFDDISPEATLTWRPSADVTAYAAYKTGFKSGGYASVLTGNIAPLPVSPLRDFTYQPEGAEGFELGLKTQMLNRSLRIDTTIYSYEYSDLQVSNVNTSTGVSILQIFNAANATQKGIEVETTYYPSAVRGLRLNGLVNYNKSQYSEFASPCYVGQSIAEGCSQGLFQGRYRQQDLSGRQMTNAPLWAAAAGFNYTFPTEAIKVEIGGDVSYKSSYNATAELSPGGLQKSATFLNAQVRFSNPERGWEFGIYAKNLTDEYRVTEVSNAPLTGTDSNTGTINGGINSRSDLSGNTNPGRTIMFQLVLRPSSWMGR